MTTLPPLSAPTLPDASPTSPSPGDPRRSLLVAAGIAILVVLGAALWLLQLGSAYPDDPTFTDWRREASLLGGLALAAAGALFGLVILLHRRFGQLLAANAALRDSAQSARRQVSTLSTLVDNLPIGTSLVGGDMRYQAINRLFIEQSGLSSDSLKVGDSVDKFVRLLAEAGEVGRNGGAVGLEEEIDSHLTQRLAGQAAHFDRRRADGRIIEVRIAPLPGGGYVSTRADVTEKRAEERRAIEAQKTALTRNLTGSLAHDFNNLLGVIIGNLELARPLVKAAGSAEDVIGEALDAAMRGAEMTRGLLAFAGRQPLRPEHVDVNALVTKTVQQSARGLHDRVEVVLEPGRDVWPVRCDPARLEAAIVELVDNARDAMPLGGQLTITTANRCLDDDYAAAHPDVAPGDYAMVVVTDTGAGIPPDLIGRIFEPFFTTKLRENGTGLGLSSVFGFLRQSGGHITVHSAAGLGTCFRLYLPRELLATASLPRADTPLRASSGEKVLVVEDNVALRRVVARQLKELGYRVAEADCAEAAYTLLDGEKMDMVFTDIVLPGGTNGFALAKTVTERWSGTKVLLTSGFPDMRPDDEPGANGGVRLLTKPYRKDDLARALREVFDT
jgi:signal transduction histidine kinase/CheY-like chemotaxis protein